jgi:acetyl esterase/lipase
MRKKSIATGRLTSLARLCCTVIFLWSASMPLLCQHETIALWPNGNPEPTTFDRPEYDPTTDANRVVSGKIAVRLTNVSHPELQMFFPKTSTGVHVGAIVLPGGGYEHLSWNMEGTEVCEWMSSLGVTCGVLKYRVPEKGRFPGNPADLEDAQQAIRIFRSHAEEWHLAPERIGVVGFSAGGNLAALLSRQFAYQGDRVPLSAISARPDFQMLLYPGGLTERTAPMEVAAEIAPNHQIPPTFVAQAMNDPAARPEATLAYVEALRVAGVPVEIHFYAEGGHGFGLRQTNLAITGWPQLAERWLRSIHVLAAVKSEASAKNVR